MQSSVLIPLRNCILVFFVLGFSSHPRIVHWIWSLHVTIMKGCKFWPMLAAYDHSACSEGSLACHTYCDTGRGHTSTIELTIERKYFSLKICYEDCNLECAINEHNRQNTTELLPGRWKYMASIIKYWE